MLVPGILVGVAPTGPGAPCGPAIPGAPSGPGTPALKPGSLKLSGMLTKPDPLSRTSVSVRLGSLKIIMVCLNLFSLLNFPPQISRLTLVSLATVGILQLLYYHLLRF
mgnify:CR=1 FL=1